MTSVALISSPASGISRGAAIHRHVSKVRCVVGLLQLPLMHKGLLTLAYFVKEAAVKQSIHFFWCPHEITQMIQDGLGQNRKLAAWSEDVSVVHAP